MCHERIFNRGWLLALSLALLTGAGAAAAKDDSKNNSSDIEEMKKKAKEAMEKVQSGAKDADVESTVDDAKKKASDKLNEGKDSLSKKWEKMKKDAEEKDKAREEQQKKEKEEKSAADKSGGNASDKAVGGDAHPGKHAGQEKEKEADSESAEPATGLDLSAEKIANLKRRREMGYLMHRRYLNENEQHMKAMAQISAKNGLKAKEQRKHIRRIARLERLRELAADVNDTEAMKRIEVIQKREIQRHENVTLELHAKAKNSGKKGE